MRPSLRQIEYALAVAEYLNFRQAAKACHVTQPALSVQVAQLESLLGVTLFERDRRRVLVTPAGREVLRLARRVMEGVDELAETALGMGRPLCGTLRLGVIPTIAPFVLPKTLARLRRRFPELRLLLRESQTSELVRQLREGSLDVALLALEADLGDLQTLPLWRDAFLLAVPAGHRLHRRRRVRESDLQREEVLLLEDGHCLRDQALEICRRAAAREWSAFRASSLTTLTEMVAGGIGVTLLPEMALPVVRTSKGLVAIPFTKPAPHRTVGLAWRRTSPRAESYALLAEELQRG